MNQQFKKQFEALSFKDLFDDASKEELYKEFQEAPLKPDFHLYLLGKYTEDEINAGVKEMNKMPKKQGSENGYVMANIVATTEFESNLNELYREFSLKSGKQELGKKYYTPDINQTPTITAIESVYKYYKILEEYPTTKLEFEPTSIKIEVENIAERIINEVNNIDISNVRNNIISELINSSDNSVIISLSFTHGLMDVIDKEFDEKKLTANWQRIKMYFDNYLSKMADIEDKNPTLTDKYFTWFTDKHYYNNMPIMTEQDYKRVKKAIDNFTEKGELPKNFKRVKINDNGIKGEVYYSFYLFSENYNRKQMPKQEVAKLMRLMFENYKDTTNIESIMSRKPDDCNNYREV